MTNNSTPTNKQPYHSISNSLAEAKKANQNENHTAEGNFVLPIPKEQVDKANVTICDRKGNKPSLIIPYRDVNGNVLFFEVRFDYTNEEGLQNKIVLPYCWWKYPDGREEWKKRQPLIKDRPLLNLPKIIKETNKPIMVVEGGKTAIASTTLFPDYISTTSCSGSGAAEKTDWSPCKGRDIIIAMDNDPPGFKYSKDVYNLCKTAGTASISFLNNNIFASYEVKDGCIVKLETPRELPKGYDLADAKEEEWTAELLTEVATEISLFVEYTDIFPDVVSDDIISADTKILQDLAKLSPIEYDRVRKEEAKCLGIKVSTLDTEVKKLQSSKSSALETELSQQLSCVDPWPDPVLAEEILNELVIVVKRFVILPEHAATALSLWVVFTWCIDAFDIAPILAIYSPEKQCGKTTLLKFLHKFVKCPLHTSNITPASLFRSIELYKPTLLIDEADTFLKSSDELRGVLNSGHSRDSAFVIRTVGDNHEPKQFCTWGAKAIALIGALPDTLHDRSIVILLKRKLIHEKTERLKHSDPNIFKVLQSKLLRFANDNQEAIKKLRSVFPENICISDRALDNWEPLLAIAELSGEDWVIKVHQAASSISHRDKDTAPIGTELLEDIKKIFENKNTDKISTVDLIEALCKDEERVWATYNYKAIDKKITARNLGRLLSPYGISTTNIETKNSRKKGFVKAHFEEAWQRYIVSSEPSKNAVLAVHPYETAENIESSPCSIRTSNSLPYSKHEENCGSVRMYGKHGKNMSALEENNIYVDDDNDLSFSKENELMEFDERSTINETTNKPESFILPQFKKNAEKLSALKQDKDEGILI